VKKHSGAIISLFVLVVTIVGQVAYLAYFEQPREVVGYLEAAIVQLYGNGRLRR
jgi:hypothetical protein